MHVDMCRLRADPTIVRMASISLRRSGERIKYRKGYPRLSALGRSMSLVATAREPLLEAALSVQAIRQVEPGARGEAALDTGVGEMGS